MTPIALARLVVEGLWDERRRVALAAFGVVIGVTSIVLLISIGTGARTYVVQQFGSIGADVLVLMPGKVETTGAIPGIVHGVPRPLTIEDTRALRRTSRTVQNLAPLTIGTQRVSFGERQRDCMVVGATGEFVAIRNHHPRIGRFFAPDGELGRGDRGACLGDTVARELFRGENPLGKVVRIGNARFRVQAVMEPKGRQQGFDLDELVFVPEPVARKLFNLRGVSRVLLRVSSFDDEEAAAREVRAILKARHRDVEDFTVLTPGSVLESLKRIIGVLTGLLSGIAAVSLVVGGIGIANTALVAATARTEEVGIKKAIGANPFWILAQFALESALLGGIGGALGAGLAALVAALVRWWFEGSLPLETPLWSVGLAVGACAAIGLVAGLAPAARAAGLDPVAALRAGGGGKK